MASDLSSGLILKALSFCILVGVTSCTETEVQLSRDDIKLADSLFLVSRNEMKPQLEDSCDVMRAVLLPIWQDSIMNERLVEINMMMEKHAAENN